MPIKQRADTGAYQVTVCLGGRTYRKTSRHWTFTDAKEFERTWTLELSKPATRQQVKLIADGLEKWLIEHVPRLRSQRQTRNHCRRLLPFIAGRPLSDCAKVWAEIKAGSIGLAPATVNHLGRILRQVSRTAWREWGWLDRPAAISLIPETPRERFLSTEEVARLAAATGNEHAAGYVLLAAYTGIRRGHLLRLTHHDVQGDFLRIDRTSKTRTLQLVPLHKKVREIAKRLPLPIGQRQLADAWMLARQTTGINVRWHDLRHTCASWLVQAGVPIYTVAELLGHSSTTVTQRYAHLAPEHLAAAVRKLA